MSISVAGELWAAFLCLMALLMMVRYHEKTAKDSCLGQMLFVGILILVSDACAWLTDGQPGAAARAGVYISNYVLYASSYLIIALFLWYMWLMVRRDGERLPVIFRILWVGIAAFILALTIGIFFDLYFYVDEANAYHRTDWYFISQLVTILGVFTLVWVAVKYRSRMTRYERIAAWAYCILPPLGTLFQFFHYGVAFQQFGFAAATMVTFIVREADVRGELRRATEREIENRKELEERLRINTALGKAYFCLYYIDLAAEEYFEIDDTSLDVVTETIGRKGRTDEAFENMSRYLVAPEQASEVLQFTDVSTVPERLQGQESIGIQFYGPHVGWCEGLFIAAKRDDSGRCTHAIWGVRSIHQEKQQEEQYKRELKAAKEAAEKRSEELDRQLDIIGSLASTFAAIYYVDMASLNYTALAASGEYVEKYIQKEGNAAQGMEAMCRHIIAPEQADVMREFTDFSTLNDRLRDRNWLVRQFKAGSGRWNEGMFIAARRDEQGNCLKVIWAVHDINEMKQLELAYQKELERARDTANAASAAKTSFLFNMSHDIRTPMNAIIGYADLIEKYQGDTERCRDYIEKIQSSSKFLLSLINNVLELARIESGHEKLDETICDTSVVQDAIVGIFTEQMQQKHLSFIHTKDIHTKYVWGDKVKLNEIILNLVSNAYKYTPEGGTIELSLKELPGDQPGWINMQTIVKDNGIGMSREYLPVLFEEFTREKTSTENRIQGTGLGMPIVKKLVDLMGGTITVESELGKGTTFTVTIPNRIAEEAAPKAEAPVEVDMDRFVGKRILLAEDNDLNAEIAIEILSEVGFEVERAADGIICVDMLQKAELGSYDLILMDIQMPNMDGYKATRTIRAMADPGRSQIPIIAMTANAFESDRRDAFAAGMNGHIAKPIEIPKLMETLAQVLQ